jgi:DNA-binding FadR family transcriptional regulator
MVKQTFLSDKQQVLFDYLIEKSKNPKSPIPSIPKITANLGISTACLREQMELAKNLGIISAKPRRGIEFLPYKFKPAVEKSVYYAVNLNQSFFFQFSDIRNHLEKSYFIESAELLDEKDLDGLKKLVLQAQNKLNGYPTQIPHQEHRDYHLSIFKPRNNVFLMGILESYWDMYEQVGLDLYNNLDYLITVWDYHQQIVEMIEKRDFISAYHLLTEHMELIDKREQSK